MKNTSIFTKKPVLVAFLLFVVIGSLIFSGCSTSSPTNTPESDNPAKSEEGPQADYVGKKILWVSSYHSGMEWQDGIGRGIQNTLEGTGIEFKSFELDTKNHPETAEQKALEAKNLIDEFKPDVIITSDDNAQKYLVVPYLMDSGIPIVFCAVNWEATSYGYPTPTITGMVEVDLVTSLVDVLKNYASGDAVGHIGLASETFTKNSDNYNARFFDGEMKVYAAESFDEFKTLFSQAQDEVDILLVANLDGMPGWTPEEEVAFMEENTKIPTGYFDSYLTPNVLVTMGKVPEEQGEFTVKTALEILDGKSPSEMPIVANENGNLGLNLIIAEKLNVVFAPSLLKNASVISE